MGYKRFLDAALVSGTAAPGAPVQPKDSFPVRLAKRRALIEKYLGDKYKMPPITFGSPTGSRCNYAYGPQGPITDTNRTFWGDIKGKDSLVWDPPADGAVFVRLIRANAAKEIVSPIDKRLVHAEFRDEGDDVVPAGTRPASWRLLGAWDLMAVVRMNGAAFEYLGGYYRPTHLDWCLAWLDRSQHFGVLTIGPPPARPEDFLQRYGKVVDNDLTVFERERLVEANRQVQLMGNEAVAFAATSELREVLNRLQ